MSEAKRVRAKTISNGLRFMAGEGWTDDLGMLESKLVNSCLLTDAADLIDAALAARHPGLEEGERVVGPENVEATIQRLAKARCEELHTCLSTSRRDGVVERPCVSCLSISGEKVNAVVGALRTAR